MKQVLHCGLFRHRVADHNSKGKFKKVPGSGFFFERTMNDERRTKNNSGLTLIGIIAVIVVMGLLGAGVLMLISTGSMESIQTLKWGQAFYAAESGVSAMRNYISTHPSWPTSAITGMVGQASFMAIIDADGVITSIGSKDESQWTSIYAGKGKAKQAMLAYGSRSDPSGTPR